MTGGHEHTHTTSSGVPESTAGSNTAGAFGDSTGPAPKTAGPHKYDILNKLDPSVDSKTGTTATGYGPGVETTPGPHGSKVLNALDPRVGSTITTGTTAKPAGSVGGAGGEAKTGAV